MHCGIHFLIINNVENSAAQKNFSRFIFQDSLINSTYLKLKSFVTSTNVVLNKLSLGVSQFNSSLLNRSIHFLNFLYSIKHSQYFMQKKLGKS